MGFDLDTVPTLEQIMEWANLLKQTVYYGAIKETASTFQLLTTMIGSEKILRGLHLNPFMWILNENYWRLVAGELEEQPIGQAIPLNLEDFIDGLVYFMRLSWIDDSGTRQTFAGQEWNWMGLWWWLNDVISPHSWVDNAMKYMSSLDAFTGTEFTDDLLQLVAPFYISVPLGILNTMGDMGKDMIKIFKPMKDILSIMRYAFLWCDVTPELRDSVRNTLETYAFTDYDQYETIEGLSADVLAEIEKLATIGFLADYGNPYVDAVLFDNLDLIPDSWKLAYGVESISALFEVITRLPPKQRDQVYETLYHDVEMGKTGLIHVCDMFSKLGQALYAPRQIGSAVNIISNFITTFINQILPKFIIALGEMAAETFAQGNDFGDLIWIGLLGPNVIPSETTADAMEEIWNDFIDEVRASIGLFDDPQARFLLELTTDQIREAMRLYFKVMPPDRVGNFYEDVSNFLGSEPSEALMHDTDVTEGMIRSDPHVVDFEIFIENLDAIYRNSGIYENEEDIPGHISYSAPDDTQLKMILPDPPTRPRKPRPPL